MSLLVPFGATWKLLANQPLQTTGVADPTGIAPSAFDDSAWPTEPGAFLSGGSGTGLAVPVTLPLGSNGPVLFQTAIGINGEAYYRKHVGPIGLVTLKGWIDNWVWIFVNGVLVAPFFQGSGGEWTFDWTFTDPDNVIAIRTRSSGDEPSGGHIFAIQIFNREWHVGGAYW